MATASSSLPVIAVTGLRAEARLAAGVGVATLSGGGDAVRLASLLQASLMNGARAVISFGIAGGVAPGLRAGTVVVADSVADGAATWTSDPQWRARLLQALPYAVRGRLAGVGGALVDAEGKRRLHHRSGALAVDMESHVAARLAAAHGVPFAALRIIADPAERTLPQAALVGMRADGSTDAKAVLKALAARPGEVAALIHTALDAQAAFSSLRRARRDLCALFGFSGSTDEHLGEADPVDLASSGEFGLALPEITAEGA